MGHHCQVIYHVAQRERWLHALDGGEYTASSVGRELADEGFIHMSTLDQVAGVLERFYAGIDDLVLLHIDESLLAAPLVYEAIAAASAQFPHLYGPLNVAAVVHVDDPLIL